VFAQYCQNVARIAELERIVDEQGYTFVTEKGYVLPRPEMGMLKSLQTLQKGLIAELGFSPSSRSRVQMAPLAPKTGDAKPTDSDEEFLFGHGRRGA
jgi:P27 family predicted phage terminase small subunit